MHLGCGRWPAGPATSVPDAGGVVAMITIGKVRNAEYYLCDVRHDDVAAYYTSVERPGRWHGQLAAAHGLAGQTVDPEAFRAVLDGRSPVTGEQLTHNATRVRALDVTLSVPKSMSVVWAVCDDRARREVVAALDAAERSVIRFLESDATVVRRGKGGHQLLPGDGLLVASFDHRTSRLGDPNLHRHLVIANASVGPDGRTTAIDTRQLYQVRYTAEAVFQAVLRHELSGRLGVGFTEIDRHGVGEIVGVPEPVCREFSRRRRAIEDEMADRGVTTGRGARIAALATRTAKRHAPDDVLHGQWLDRATRLGFDPGRIPVRRQHLGSRRLVVENHDIAALVTAHAATYTRRDVIRSVARLAHRGATLDAIEAATATYLASRYAVERQPGLYTTPEMLDMETAIVEWAVRGQGRGTGVASAAAVDQALAARPHLSDEQRDLVRRTARGGDDVTVIVGKAGAGKTTALDALRSAYEHDGFRVIGAALSARAAAELHAGAGIDSLTIHRTLNALARSRLRLDHRSVLVVDEAAMVGTRQLNLLTGYAAGAGAKVVLVGDPRQLPEIDAGGTFAAIARRVRPVVLNENRRQADPDTRAALDALRAAKADIALGLLHRSGQLTVGANADSVRTALVADWSVAVRDGRHAVMIAAHRSDVTDRNARARDLLASQGRLGPAIWRNDSTEFAAGDRVVAHRNHYRLGLLNGATGTVTRAGPDHLGIRLDTGRHVDVPNRYIDDGHLTHGYALTVHKAQGMTCDAAYLLGDDGLFNELGYTGLSRGRHHNHLYTVASRDETDHLAADPLADVRHALTTSRAQTAAIDTPTHDSHLGISR